MKFLILTMYYPPEIGAAPTRLSAMAGELLARGHEVEIVTALPNYPAGRIAPGYEKCLYRSEECDGIRAHRVWLYACVGTGMKRLANYLSFTATCVIGLLKASKPDCIVVESPPLFLGIPGYLFARARRIPLNFNVSDLWPDSVVAMGFMKPGVFIRLACWLERWTYRQATYVTAMTEGIRSALIHEKRVPEQKVLFLPNGVDLIQFRPREPELDLKRRLGLEGKKIVLNQGTQGYAHGLEAVLHTAAHMLQDKDVHFVFVGTGSEHRKLEALKAELGLSNVTFLDPVPLCNLGDYFSIAECGLISLKDNPVFRGARPAKTNPIIASGKPVVFFGSGEGAELVLKANAGRIVRYGDIEGLAQAIREIVANPMLADGLGRNGRRYAEDHLSWSDVVGRWLTQLRTASL